MKEKKGNFEMMGFKPDNNTGQHLKFTNYLLYQYFCQNLPTVKTEQDSPP